MLTLLLEEEGYEVETAASGEAAVSRVAVSSAKTTTCPNIILTDIQMPGLAGDALAMALRPLLPPETLLIAMSGSQPASSALGGFDGFLLKPFTVTELRSMISGKGRRAAQETKTHRTDPPGYKPRPSPLDGEIYAKMGELMPVAQLGQMYALCLGDARSRIAKMHAFAAAGDDAQYRSEAHAVKGGCGMIGASELYELSAAAEESGLLATETNPRTSSVIESLARLSRACDNLERILLQRAQE